MISGQFINDEARILLTLHDAYGQRHEIEAVVDTGFNDYLLLTYPIVQRLCVTHIRNEVVFLADGTSSRLGVYNVTLEWHDGQREVPAFAADGDCLIGMKLLRGSLLTVQGAENGAVTIEPLD